MVLPTGATSGPRIVLNGPQGRIEVYSDAGNLMMTIDDDGFLVWDAQGDQRVKLGSSEDFASVGWRDSAGAHPAIMTYQAIPGGDDYRAMVWQAPDIGGIADNMSRIFLLTPTNTVKNPLLQWDTGLLDPTVAQPIVDLTGFTGGLAAVVVAADYKIGSSNGGGNAPTLGASLPRGIIAHKSRSTSVTFDGETQVLQCDPCTLIAGRRYRFQAAWRALAWGTVTANAVALMRIRDLASTVRVEHHEIVISASAQDGATMTGVLDCAGEISSGSHTFELTAQRALGGAGNLQMSATSTGRITLDIEDVGEVI
jgi:hypothetical protein